jgi:uncharacterized protein (TIGR02145 family)/prepilin-type N-terminal cleavage/methylation domain-containing protein
MFPQNILRYKKKQSAFTLIELLIVIGIIAILAVAVIITTTPGKRLAEARDATRTKHLHALESALYVYNIDEGEFPESPTTLTEICNTNLETPNCSGLIDLSSMNITIPVDPQGYYGNSNGTGYEMVVKENTVKVHAPKRETCGFPIVDSDANVYKTVEIDNQCYTAENLKYLPSVVGPATGSTSTPYYYVYGYDGTDVEAAKAHVESGISVYSERGVLYNHPAALTACPSGWRLPTDAEQHALDNYFATGTCRADRAWPDADQWDCSPAGTKLKATTFNGDNVSGFTALPAGNRYTDESFSNLTTNATFWSGTESSSTNAWSRGLHSSNSTVYRNASNKGNGFSVRCLRD